MSATWHLEANDLQISPCWDAGASMAEEQQQIMGDLAIGFSVQTPDHGEVGRLQSHQVPHYASDATNQADTPSSSEKTVLLANLHERVAGTTQLAKYWQVLASSPS